MAATVRSSANVAGGSGATGWSARSLFAPPPLLIAPNIVDSIFNTLAMGLVTQTATAAQHWAQAFTLSSGDAIASIMWALSTFGSPTDGVYCEIQTDASNAPSGSVVTNGTSTTVAASAMPAGSTVAGMVRFAFPTPPSLSGSTKYWAVFKRTGAMSDTANYVGRRSTTTDAYASHAYASYDGSAWTTTASEDLVFAVESSTVAAPLYAVVQDTALHVYKSTDNGGSWSEQDSANAPSVNSATKPFSATYHPNYGIVAQYFTGTNTTRLRVFNLPADTWASTPIQNANATTDADVNRNVRPAVTNGRIYNFFTSLADDADLRYTSRTTGAWGAATNLLAVTDADASSFLDVVQDYRTSLFVTMLWQDISTDTVKVQTITGTTQGTATNVDATGADTEAEHASAVYDVSWDGTSSKIVAAFIDADGTLEERILTLGVTAASISQATQHQVSASTSYAGRQLATCVYGSDAYVFACTGSGIDVYKDTGIAGSWAAAVNWKSGLTNCYLSSVTPVSGYGILVIYNDNGDVKVDAFAVHATGTVATGTHSVTGQAVQATTGTVATVATAALATTGQAITGTAGSGTTTGTVATGSMATAGQAVSGTVSVSGTIGTGAHTVTGHAVSAATGTTGSVSTGALAVSGQAVAGRTGTLGTLATGAMSVTGQAVTSTTGTSATVASGALSVAGQAVQSTTGTVATVTTGPLSVTGHTVSASTATTGAVATGLHAVTGHTVSGTTGAVASVTTGGLSIAGHAVAATTGTLATIGTGGLAVSGQPVDATAGVADQVTGSVSAGSLAVSGQGVAALVETSPAITTGTVVVQGQTVIATVSTVGAIGAHVLVVSGQGVVATAATTGLLDTGGYTVSGQPVSAAFGQTATITTGTLHLTGQAVIGSVLGTGDLDAQLVTTVVLTATIHAMAPLAARVRAATPIRAALDSAALGDARYGVASLVTAGLEIDYGI